MTSPKTVQTTSIPALTPEETSMAYDATHLEHPSLALVLRYLHWAKARGEMLDTMLKEGSQLALYAERYMREDRALTLDVEAERKEGKAENGESTGDAV